MTLGGVALAATIVLLLPADDRTDEVDVPAPLHATTLGSDAPDTTPQGPLPPNASPSCIRADGTSCGPSTPGLAEVVLATPTGDGRWLMVDRDGRAMGVDDVEDGAQVRWETGLPEELATSVALRETTPVGGARMSVRVVGTTAYLGDGAGVTAIDLGRGAVAWRATLGGSAAPPAFRVWPVDDVLLAVGGAEIVLLGSDGDVRWRTPRPPGDVQPIDGGVAVVGRARIEAFGIDDPEPRWAVSHPAPGSRAALGVVAAARGPLLLDGARTLVLSPADGQIVADHGSEAVATRVPDGTVVVADFDVPGDRLRWSASTGEGWRRPGPALRCCELALRPTQDGAVLAATAARGVTEVGWLLEPRSGETRTPIVRPDGAAPLPIAADGDVAVWRQGDAFIGAGAADGTVRWRTNRAVVVLNESPLLLATPDGPVLP